MKNAQTNHGLYYREMFICEPRFTVRTYHTIKQHYANITDAQTMAFYGKKCLHGEVKNAGLFVGIELLRFSGMGVYDIHQNVNTMRHARGLSAVALSTIRTYCETLDKIYHTL